MALSNSGVSAADFNQINTEWGQTITYEAVTKTIMNITGAAENTYAAGVSKSWIFFKREKRYMWDPEGLLQLGDAYLIIPSTDTIYRYDKITVDLEVYRVEMLIPRKLLDTTIYSYAVLFKISDLEEEYEMSSKTVYAGSVCTGIDNATGRTLTHTSNMGSNSLVIVGRVVLIVNVDYSTSSAVITFNIPISNSDTIMIVA